MRKLIILLLVLSSIALVGCKKDDEPIEYDIPAEGTIDKLLLPYSEYFRLDNPVITIEVKYMGEITIELFPQLAPNTVNSMIKYINDGDYANNSFHRVVNSFMIQGGGLTDPSCTIQGEMNNNPAYEGTNGLSHYAGVISMARVGGLYDSASSQFFIVHNDSSFLDNEYATFGGVVKGFNIVDFIAKMEVEGTELPSDDIIITNITVEMNGYVASAPICE